MLMSPREMNSYLRLGLRDGALTGLHANRPEDIRLRWTDRRDPGGFGPYYIHYFDNITYLT